MENKVTATLPTDSAAAMRRKIDAALRLQVDPVRTECVQALGDLVAACEIHAIKDSLSSALALGQSIVRARALLAKLRGENV